MNTPMEKGLNWEQELAAFNGIKDSIASDFPDNLAPHFGQLEPFNRGNHFKFNEGSEYVFAVALVRVLEEHLVPQMMGRAPLPVAPLGAERMKGIERLAPTFELIGKAALTELDDLAMASGDAPRSAWSPVFLQNLQTFVSEPPHNALAAWSKRLTRDWETLNGVSVEEAMQARVEARGL